MKKLLETAAELYGFESSAASLVPPHRGGRNTVYRIGTDRILRIGTLTDRAFEDYAAEAEYVCYLRSGGASVAGVLPAKDGSLIARISDGREDHAVMMFETARGDQLADHGYRYIDGVPIEEYWANTGRTLGRVHALSKEYRPQTKRFDFFDKYSEDYFDTLIPDGFVCPFLGDQAIGKRVKQKLHLLLERLRGLPTGSDNYGMIHFDYSDGNYNIDYTDGTITVYDFDNCRTGWYLFDLANLWTHGVGWIAWHNDASERQRFMTRYFDAVVKGYRSECAVTDDMLSCLPLMIDAVRLENIIDEFEVQRAAGESLSADGEQAFRLKGLLEDIPFMGFFDACYDPESPFDLDP